MAETGIRVDVEGRTLTISNLDKVLYPRTGTTKGEVLNYYARISPVMLPHLADRRRHPDPVAARRRAAQLLREERARRHAVLGAHRAGPDDRVARGDSRHGDTLEFPIVDDLATLTWLANLAALELHVHQWTVGRNGQPRNPDRLVIDLDPGEPRRAARVLPGRAAGARRAGRAGPGVRPVTSGSKGLHLYAALPGD